MASERCLIVVHYTGTQVGNHAPCDHLSIITKNHQCHNPKSRPTLTQIIELLLSDSEKHDLFWGRSPTDPLVKHGKVVSLTLFVNDPQSVVYSQNSTRKAEGRRQEAEGRRNTVFALWSRAEGTWV